MRGPSHGARPRSRSSGFTLVEIVVALLVGATVLYGTAAAIRQFTRPVQEGEADQEVLQQLLKATTRLERDLRDARQILYPGPDDPPSRLLYIREFEGRICTWYYSPDRRELRRAILDLTGLPVESREDRASGLDDASFHMTRPGLLSWGVFSGDVSLLGSVKRSNR